MKRHFPVIERNVFFHLKNILINIIYYVLPVNIYVLIWNYKNLRKKQ